MKKSGLGKILILLVVLAVLCYLYFDDKLNYEYMSMVGEMMVELLKHILLELIEHLRF